MSKEAEKLIIDLRFGNVEKTGAVAIELNGTGIDCKNPRHQLAVRQCMHVVAAELYAVAHGIPAENIGFEKEEEEE